MQLPELRLDDAGRHPLEPVVAQCQDAEVGQAGEPGGGEGFEGEILNSLTSEVLKQISK